MGEKKLKIFISEAEKSLESPLFWLKRALLPVWITLHPNNLVQLFQSKGSETQCATKRVNFEIKFNFQQNTMS